MKKLCFMLGSFMVVCSLAARDLLWTGETSTAWTGANNWRDLTTGADATYANKDNVLFDDTLAPGITEVSLQSAQTPGACVFNIAGNFLSKGYNFFGATSITKTGPGTLNLLCMNEQCHATSPIHIK